MKKRYRCQFATLALPLLLLLCLTTFSATKVATAFVAPISHYSQNSIASNGKHHAEQSTTFYRPPRRRRTQFAAPEDNEFSSAGKRTTRCHLSGQTAILSGLLACTILMFPLQAQAGFGPSGGATTSQTPGVFNIKVQDLSQKKLQQLIDSTIDETRLTDFRSQLDALIGGITSSFSSDEESSDGETSEQQSPLFPPKRDVEEVLRLEKARGFQAQISSRERLLNKLESQPYWFNYFAAFCGSVASTLVMHPVDTIKTRLQVQVSNATDDESGRFSNLYEGLSGNILKEGPPSALYLGVYETVKASLLHGKLAIFWAGLLGVASSPVAKVVTATNPTYLLSIYLVAGAAGEMVGSIIRAPAEAIKTCVQTQAASSTKEAFEFVFGRDEGRRNVFRAWSASLFRDVPFGAIQLALFELIKAYILNDSNLDIDSSTLQSEAIIGAFAGGCGAFITNPTDVITTRIITQSTAEEDDEPLGVIAMGRLIFEEGGVGAFFAGWEARVLYWAPAISIFLTCYCTVRQTGVKLDLFG